MKTKKWMTIVAVMVGMLTAVGTQAANITAYLDVNGTSSGSGVTNGGSYSASSAIWTSDSTGAYATPVTLAGNRAAFYFSAGTDASNCSYVVTDALGDVTTGLTVQEGYVTLTGGGRFYGSSSISCAENTSLSFSTGAWSFYSQPVTFNTSTNSTIYCNVGISGGTAYNCSFSKTGDGLMVMNTSATAIGSITASINGGKLRLQNGNVLFYTGKPCSVTVTNGGTLELQNDITVANNAITLSGMGYNNLGALNNYSGINLYSWTNAISLAGHTRINASAGQLTFANGFFTNNYNLVFGGAGDLVVNNSIYTGTGSLIKDGSGTLTVGGTNTYSGAMTISNGTLMVAGSCVLTNTSAISVNTGARFNVGRSWDSTSANKIVVSGAATVDAGNGVGVNMSGVYSSGTACTILQAASGLGTVNYYVLNPINYTAVFSKSATQVQITPTTATPLTTAYWKGTTTSILSNRWAASDGNADGNWASTAGGSVQALVPGTNADVFISVTSPVVAPVNTVLGDNMSIKSLTIQDTVNGLGLNADGNTLTVGTGGITMKAGVPASTIAARVALGTSQTWTNNSTSPLTISGSVIPGGNTLTNAGSGTIVLSGASTLGTVVVSTGTLQFNNSSTKIDQLTLTNGTVDLAADLTTTGSGLINGGGGSINSSGGRLMLGLAMPNWRLTGTITINAVIGGSNYGFSTYGGSGSSALILSGANTFSGTIRVSDGPIQIGVDSVGSVGNIVSSALGIGTVHFGDGSHAGILYSSSSLPRTIYNPIIWTTTASAGITLGNATKNGKLTFSNTMDLGGYTRPFTINSDVEFAGTIGSTNGITKAGPATLTLSGVNTFTGPLTISTGLLAVEGAGQLGIGNFATNIVNNAAFVYNSSADQILGGPISGTGSLTKTNVSALMLNGLVSNTVLVAGGYLGGTGMLIGTVTNFAAIGAATASTIGTLSVSNLVMKENASCLWNYNDTTNDVIQVTGSLTLPNVATVNVSQVTSGQLPKEGVLFSSGTPLLGASNLSGWVVRGDGVHADTRMVIRGNRVIISSMGGTLISFH